MNNRSNANKLIFLLGVLAIITTAYLVADFKARSHQQAHGQVMVEQESKLKALVTQLQSNTTNEFTDRFVVGCDVADQAEYDRLLSNLDNTLPRTEALRLKDLIIKCGYVDAARWLHQIKQFNIILDSYRPVVRLRSDENLNQRLVYLEAYAAAIESRALNYEALVRLQQAIVEAVAGGLTLESEAVRQLLTLAEEKKTALAVDRQKIQELLPNLNW